MPGNYSIPETLTPAYLIQKNHHPNNLSGDNARTILIPVGVRLDNPYEAELPVCLPVYRLPFWLNLESFSYHVVAQPAPVHWKSKAD